MRKTQTVCLVILTTIAIGFAMYYLRSVLLPFVIAMFVVIGCRPILEFIEEKLKLHRFLAFVVAFLFGAAVLAGFAFFTWLSINDLSSHSEAYEQRLQTIVKRIAQFVPDSTAADSKTPDTAPSTSDPAPESVDEAESVDEPKSGYGNAAVAMEEFLTWVSGFIRGQLLLLASTLSNLLSYGILILIFVFFLLFGQDPAQKQPVILDKVEDKIRQYLVVKTVISLVTGFAFGLVLWLFGVPLAILFGFLAFLLNFIPNIGPLISTVLPVPFLMLNAEMSPTSAIICFVLIASIQFISGNVIETRIMGQSFDVSPVVLLLALMFFGLVWGILGMFLATPIVSILKIVLQQYSATRPISELLAGRWSVSDNTIA